MWLPTPLPAGNAFSAASDQENLCEICYFLMAPMPSRLLFPQRLAQKNMLRLKPGTPFSDAALTEPLACVVQGVKDCQLARGDRVLILGAGPIGLMFVAVAQHLGCEVTVAGRRAVRLETASRLGAHTVVDVESGDDLPKRVRDAAPNAVYDTVIEAVGKPEVWEAAVRLVRKGGTVNFFGGCPSRHNRHYGHHAAALFKSDSACQFSSHPARPSVARSSISKPV